MEFTFVAATDYETLLSQAKSMASLIRAMEKTKTFQATQLQELSRELSLLGREEIDAEKQTNERLTGEVERLEQEVQGLRTLVNSLEVELNTFRQAVQHVTEMGKTRRSFSTNGGWAMIHAERLTELEIFQEKFDNLPANPNDEKD